MIRPGLVSVTFRQLGAEAIVNLASSCGLVGIEWGGDVHVPHGDIGRAHEVRDLTLDAGLRVAAYGSYWRADREFGTVLNTALALGAPTVRAWAGHEGMAREEIVARLREACELARRAGRTVSLEYHQGTLTDTLESTLRLVREVAHPNLRLYWQPFPERPHSERLGELRAILPHLTNLHVFQWTQALSETVRRPLAEGEAEWRDYLRLAARGNRYAMLEFVPGDDPSRLAREAATLKELLGATGAGR